MGGNCFSYKELIKHRFKIMTLLSRKTTKSKRLSIPNKHIWVNVITCSNVIYRPMLSTTCFRVNNHLRKQACNLLQEAGFERLDLSLDWSFAWKITKKKTHQASTLWEVSVKSRKILNCFLKDDFSPTLPHISQGNKSRSPKSSQTEIQRLHSFESTAFEGNSDCEVLSPSLPLYFSPEHARLYWWKLSELFTIKSFNN